MKFKPGDLVQFVVPPDCATKLAAIVRCKPRCPEVGNAFIVEEFRETQYVSGGPRLFLKGFMQVDPRRYGTADLGFSPKRFNLLCASGDLL